MTIGQLMYSWCKDLFPLNRSLSGEGNRETLSYLQKLIPELEVREISSSEAYFDWTTPNEWNVEEAFIEDMQGVRIIDWADSNLHLVGYSTPVDAIFDRETLLRRIHTVDDLENAIPYKTSYYIEDWGFCVSKSQKSQLRDKEYRVVIKSELKKGKILSGEVIYPGSSGHEILLSSYICHPSMANNELSGPVVLTALLQKIRQMESRYYTYRATFHPETIGAVSYVYRNKLNEPNPVIAAWVFTCMGGPAQFSLMPSKYPNSLPERITKKALKNLAFEFEVENFLQRGSDERQFTSPQVEIPTVSVMKSMYGKYVEYHTSLDNLSFISSSSLESSLEVMTKVLEILEQTPIYRSKSACEPFLIKHALAQGIRDHETEITFRDVLNVHMYCDGSNSITDLADLCKLPSTSVEKICTALLERDIIY